MANGFHSTLNLAVQLAIVLLLRTLSFTSHANAECLCGFLDPIQKQLFTDSIIVYFDEFTELPVNGFTSQSYENKYELGFNTAFREGASPSNLQINTTTAPPSLALSVSAATQDHLVVGGGLRTLRQDIQYGSFRSYMQSPPRSWNEGTELSMLYKFNQTEFISLSMLNTNYPENAYVGTLMQLDFPSYKLGINYSQLENTTSNPWVGFHEYRIDWYEKSVAFYIDDILIRLVERNDLPSTPGPMYFKHWSNGDWFSVQGPPSETVQANIGWVRLFFNVSTMTAADHRDFNARCQASDACLTTDTSLRETTDYPPEALLPWKYQAPNRGKRTAAIWMTVISAAFTAFVLFNAFIRRVKSSGARADQQNDDNGLTTSLTSDGRGIIYNDQSLDDSSSVFGTWTPSYSKSLTDVTIVGNGGVRSSNQSEVVSARSSSLDITEISPYSPMEEIRFVPLISPPMSSSSSARSWLSGGSTQVGLVFDNTKRNMIDTRVFYEEKNSVADVSAATIETTGEGDNSEKKEPDLTEIPEALPQAPVNAPKQRVDYLAGFVAFFCILVTIVQFSLTYLPALIVPGGDARYPSEQWLRKTIGPYFLNAIWLGVFFTTSSRFLAAKYLQDGDLQVIAEKVVGRTFRIIGPVAVIALLEYFLIECGAIYWLKYLPSVTWSTWPYVVIFPGFGNYVSEVIELLYLVPNAIPQMTYNFCTGVLWTIPVQLQGSWLVLTGVIVIREIKNPWKRFGYYIFCIVSHWYATSWGSFFWFGLLLADLDITFKYRKWLYTRPGFYYSLVSIYWFSSFINLSLDMLAQWIGVQVSTYERGIHPDQATALPIMQTSNGGFPQYYDPTLNSLLFCASFHALVDISPIVQKFFSGKILLLIFRHIFTIYLLHGFVFWSWGAWFCIKMIDVGVKYWAVTIIVALTSYACIVLSLPFTTPLIEIVGKNLGKDLWTLAYEEPLPRMPSTYPFSPEMFTVPAETSAVEIVEDEIAGGDLREKGVVVEGQSSSVESKV